MQSNKEYLGDSVYIDFDGWSFKLTTENGFGPNNTIVLEPQVIAAFFEYYNRIMKSEEEKEPDDATQTT